MSWYPGAGHFSLLILGLVISWAPSQEKPTPIASFLNTAIVETQGAAKRLYESYLQEEISLKNETNSVDLYGSQLNLSSIRVYTSTFLQRLQRIENFTTSFHKTLINNTTYVIQNLLTLHLSLPGTNTTSLPVEDPKTVFGKKLFALKTLKQFSDFMTHLCIHRHYFTGLRSDKGKACLQGTLKTTTNA